MIMFYPTVGVCTPIIVADMTDSSDQWSAAKAFSLALLNKPAGVITVNKPKIYSCKYNYSVQHNGVPLGAALKMSLRAAIASPPSELIARVSVNYVSSAESIDQMADALVEFANPQLQLMTAVIIERISTSAELARPFVTYSVALQPDSFGTNATLYIKGASFNDTMIQSELGFQLNITEPLNTQLTALCTRLEYTCTFDTGVATGVPVSGRLFQPAPLAEILNEICLQNRIIPDIDEQHKTIVFHSQNAAPDAAAAPARFTFSFLGYGRAAIMWGVGVENYANVKFKTPIFDAKLFEKITIYNDSQSALFEGFRTSRPRAGVSVPAAYDAYVLRYTIDRNNAELRCEVTATNNWLLAQIRIEGILESKIFSGVL